MSEQNEMPERIYVMCDKDGNPHCGPGVSGHHTYLRNDYGYDGVVVSRGYIDALEAKIDRLTRRGIEDMKHRIAELEAIVSRLPHTADGVPMVPGDEVWYPKELWRSWLVDFADDIWQVHINPDHKGNVWYGVPPRKCYSTKQAAEEASKA